MTSARVDILMYHSISENAGPTNIAPATFEAQIRALAESGLPVLSMDDYVAHRQANTLPPRSVVITFDDGFQDFADVAWPILKRHEMTAINYLPTAYLGGWGEFDPAGGKRDIMTMQTARALVQEGALMGCHTITHPHLTKLDDAQLTHELEESKTTLEQGLGRSVPHIAPPFGDVNARVNEQIARLYQTSVTTELRPSVLRDKMTELPRLEMFYFNDISKWQGFLAGKMGYLTLRKILREVGKLRHIGR